MELAVVDFVRLAELTMEHFFASFEFKATLDILRCISLHYCIFAGIFRL